jgi:hypothetical protein
MNHDGLEALDISCNDLTEQSGEDFLRLPRNNPRITMMDVSGNAFSKYITARVARYCQENINTFNQDPLNPFGAACSYLRDARDISDQHWDFVSELWLALTALYSSKSNPRKPEQHGELVMIMKNEEEYIKNIDQEGNHRARNGVVMANDATASREHDDEFLIPPVATAPLLSLVWWRAFEQIVNKIDDPMVLLSFAPLAKPSVTRREIPVDEDKKKKLRKQQQEKRDAENGGQTRHHTGSSEEDDDDDENNQQDESSNNQKQEEEQEEEIDETEEELNHINDLLRHKARQQFQTTVLRAFIIAVPFAQKSWHHVENALYGLGESLRALGVTMVDLRRFHLALINALKVEIGEQGFDISRHQTAWVQVSSLIFRKLMEM